MAQVFYVFIGGGIGSSCRYLISLFATRYLGSGFPVGTLIVNLTGCFLIGFLFTLAGETRYLPPAGRIFLITGFLGGLTTFSSYGPRKHQFGFSRKFPFFHIEHRSE